MLLADPPAETAKHLVCIPRLSLGTLTWTSLPCVVQRSTKSLLNAHHKREAARDIINFLCVTVARAGMFEHT